MFKRTRALLHLNTAHPFSSLTGSAAQPKAKWLSDLREQAARSRHRDQGQRVQDYLKKNWLPLLAGAEGFLTGPRWGLVDHQILWGNMVRI